MATKSLPLEVSSKLKNETTGLTALSVSTYENKTSTGESAPVLISVKADGNVTAEEFAAKMVANSAGGSEAEARLFVNAFAAVIGELTEQYGAVTIQTPFGTIETFVAGSLENAQDPIDPSVNVPFLAIVPPETYRKQIASIQAYVPTSACPASLKWVRDSLTADPVIYGTRRACLDGKDMSYGSAGEKLELLSLAGTKICDATVVTNEVSPAMIPFTLPATTAIAAGKYRMRLTTLAGAPAAGGTLWPLEVEATLATAITPPTPHTLTKVSQEANPDNTIQFDTTMQVNVLGTNLSGFNASRGDTVKWELVENGVVTDTSDNTQDIASTTATQIHFEGAGEEESALPFRGSLESAEEWYGKSGRVKVTINGVTKTVENVFFTNT